MKSDIDIKDALYTFLKGTQLAEEATGSICKRSVRDPKSEKEDIVIKVVANVVGQKQEATIYVNVYVQDDYISTHAQNEEKTSRLRTLSQLCLTELETFRLDDARVKLEEQRIIEAGNDKEHVISNKLNYELINED